MVVLVEFYTSLPNQLRPLVDLAILPRNGLLMRAADDLGAFRREAALEFRRLERAHQLLVQPTDDIGRRRPGTMIM